MSMLEAIVLALVQGLTEFLPISSSGHIVLGAWLFGWEDPGLLFNAVVHMGTLAAVLAYFWRDWTGIAIGFFTASASVQPADGEEPYNARRMVVLITLGTAPIAAVGAALYLFAEDFLSESVRDPTTVGWLLLVTAAILSFGEFAGRHVRAMHALRPRDALLVGIAQVAAALPGISRSGVTISAGMAGHMTRATAARFSFFLAAPAILGDGAAQVIDLVKDGAPAGGAPWGALAVAAVAAFFSAILAIKGLLALLRARSLRPFIGYCIVAGIAVLLARAAGY